MQPPRPGPTERRAARARWPIRKTRLGDPAQDDLSASTTYQERLAMMWELAEQAWLLGGRPLPEYTRANCPIRRIGPGEPRDDAAD